MALTSTAFGASSQTRAAHDAGDSFSRQLRERIASFDQRFHDKFGDLEAKDAPPGAALC